MYPLGTASPGLILTEKEGSRGRLRGDFKAASLLTGGQFGATRLRPSAPASILRVCALAPSFNGGFATPRLARGRLEDASGPA